MRPWITLPPSRKLIRGVLITLVLIFFLFPIFWIFLMSFQTNETILRIPPQHRLRADIVDNYSALITGKLQTTAGNLDIAFMRNLWNSVLLSTVFGGAVAAARRAGGLCLCALPVPARRGHRLHAAVLPLRAAAAGAAAAQPLFQELGLTNTYIGLIWVYQLICLPLILWIVRGYFEDISPDIEHAYRIAGNSWWKTFRKIAMPLARPGIAAAGLLAFIFAWNNFVFALILASADKQPVTVGALAFVTASGIQYGQIAAAIVLSVTPTLALALYAQRYLVEGLSLGAVKG